MSQYTGPVEASGSLTAERSYDGKTLLSVQQTAVIAVGLRKKVYIGLRSDALPGAGLLHDPFDGSTADKFDAIMRDPDKIGSDTEIILLPGTFQTRGWTLLRDDFSWRLRPGCKLRGRGIGVTTLKLVEANVENAAYYVIHGAYGAPSDAFWHPAGGYWNDCEVSDLTIDCNFLNQPANASNKTIGTNAVWLFGSRCKIERVRVLHAGSASGAEVFLLALGQPLAPPNAPGTIYDLLLADCIVEQLDYNDIDRGGMSIYAFINGESSDGLRAFINHGVMRGNVFDNQFSNGTIPTGLNSGGFSSCIAMFGAGYDVVIEGNQMRNGAIGVYIDTWAWPYLTIRNNQFQNVNFGVLFSLGGTSPFSGNLFTFDKLVIENNDIALRQTAGASSVSGISLVHPNGDAFASEIYSDVLIRGNRIHLVDNNMDTANHAGQGITVLNGGQVQIEDNVIQLPHSTAAEAATGSMKNSIILKRIARLQARNNRRPEDNSIILPYDALNARFLGDMEFEQHKAAILRMSRF